MKQKYYVARDQGYELYHHGILGMKWGVRRFQNDDGSLTEVGKKRYGRSILESSYKKAKKKAYHKAAVQLGKKYASDMIKEKIGAGSSTTSSAINSARKKVAKKAVVKMLEDPVNTLSESMIQKEKTPIMQKFRKDIRDLTVANLLKKSITNPISSKKQDSNLLADQTKKIKKKTQSEAVKIAFNNLNKKEDNKVFSSIKRALSAGKIIYKTTKLTKKKGN